MRLCWGIRLYLKKGGKYKCVIIDETGRRYEAEAVTPQDAYSRTTVQMVVKPWLDNAE